MNKTFQVGDLVLPQAEAFTSNNTGKLMPTWEGIYMITEVLKSSTYKLQTINGKPIPNT